MNALSLRYPYKKLNVNVLVRMTGTGQLMLSQHLKYMREYSLVLIRRERRDRVWPTIPAYPANEAGGRAGWSFASPGLCLDGFPLHFAGAILLADCEYGTNALGDLAKEKSSTFYA